MKELKEKNKWIGEARAINSDLDFFKNKFINPLRKCNRHRCLWKSKNFKWKT